MAQPVGPVPGPGPGPGVPVRAHRRARLVVLTVVGLLLALPVVVLVAAGSHLSGNLVRVEGVFDGLGGRPAVPIGAEGATNVLVVVTDRGTGPGGNETASELTGDVGRSDTLMVLHLDADRRVASVVSIPRDTLVDVPGHGRRAISAAFELGGPRLGVQTVEALTGVRVDHLAVVDWSRFGALVDAVGGIHVDVAAANRDPASGLAWEAGRNVLDGAGAVAFVRQTAGLPGGDLDRIARQHAVLAAVMADALHQEMRKDPLLLYRFLDTLTEHLAIDADWSLPDMGSLAFSMRNFRSAQISYLTMPVVPVGATGADGGGAQFQPDGEASRTLWDAVAHDRVAEWTAEHPDALTPPVVR